MQYLTHTAPVPLDGGSTDGASVMSGAHRGVIAHIKQIVPKFIATHCVAHRLALAASQATSASPTMTRFERILSQIYFLIQEALHVHLHSMKWRRF